jgi:hypothetical protein
MEDDKAGDAKSGSFIPSPYPNSHGGGICCFSQTLSLADSYKTGFQLVNNSLEPAVFAMFTEAL